MGLTRGEFLARVGLLREIEPLTVQAYRFVDRLEAEKPDQGHQHDAPWHVAFHGSQFPGDNPRACARKQIYTMIDAPRIRADSYVYSNRRLTQVADAGKDIERQIVRRWWQSGMLVSAPPDAQFQTQFEDADHWLTCTVDAIVLKPRAVRPIVCEIKSKDAATIDAMQRLIRAPDPGHEFQIRCEIGLAHEHGPWEVMRCINSGRLAVEIGIKAGVTNGDGAQQEIEGVVRICPEHGGDKCLEPDTLPPVEHGYLYYVSRDNPEDTREFYYEYDPEFMRKGREQIKMWQRYFLEGYLPQVDFKGKNPMGWNWTTDDSPCKYCRYGSNTGTGVCREDHQEAVKRGELLPLVDSLAVEEAGEVRAEYNLDLVRAAVMARWGIEHLES